jgi:hypothetical protein
MDTLTAPGRAVIKACPDCKGAGCEDCKGTGRELWRACPACGDLGWVFVAGDRSEASGMACGCGFTWAAGHPGWVIQHLP